jgi:hypothetical protein
MGGHLSRRGREPVGCTDTSGSGTSTTRRRHPRPTRTALIGVVAMVAPARPYPAPRLPSQQPPPRIGPVPMHRLLTSAGTAQPHGQQCARDRPAEERLGGMAHDQDR